MKWPDDEYAELFGDAVDCRIEAEVPPRKFPEGSCEYCGITEGVKLESSRTAYSTTPIDRYDRILKMDEPGPNAPLLLCRECAEEHHANWDALWSDYYSSIM